MKWILSILSIYLIALSCLPCADIEVNSPVHDLAKLAPIDEQHSHDKEKDSCSPFCFCNCCGAQVLSYQSNIPFGFTVVSAMINMQLPTYKSVFASNFFGSIWQPPQIV
ncbi:DUF6660 family protein [Flavobacterium sp. LB2R40]|uniref:DUF6660 family protein n=1 Tax=unclassified Flavobacterium TaxID=196869 RepID=UPI003AAEB2DC